MLESLSLISLNNLQQNFYMLSHVSKLTPNPGKIKHIDICRKINK